MVNTEIRLIIFFAAKDGKAVNSHQKEDLTHGHHQMVNTEIRLIMFFAVEDREDLYSQQKQDLELTVPWIMSSLLQNSGLN